MCAEKLLLGCVMILFLLCQNWTKIDGRGKAREVHWCHIPVPHSLHCWLLKSGRDTAACWAPSALNGSAQQQPCQARERCLRREVLFHQQSVFKTLMCPPAAEAGLVQKSRVTRSCIWLQRGPVFNPVEGWSTTPGLKPQGCPSPAPRSNP